MQPVLWCVMCGVCDVGCAVVVGVLSVLWGVLWGVFSFCAMRLNVTVWAVVCGVCWGVCGALAKSSCHQLGRIGEKRTLFNEPGQQQAISQFSQGSNTK